MNRNVSIQLPDIEESVRMWVNHMYQYERGDDNALFMGNFIVSHASILCLYRLALPILRKIWPEPDSTPKFQYYYTVDGSKVKNEENILSFLQHVRRKSVFCQRQGPVPVNKTIRKNVNIDGEGPHLGMFQFYLDQGSSCIDRQLLYMLRNVKGFEAIDFHPSRKSNRITIALQKPKQKNKVSHVGIVNTNNNYANNSNMGYSTISTVSNRGGIYQVLTTAMLYRVEDYRKHLNDICTRLQLPIDKRADSTIVELIQKLDTVSWRRAAKTMRTTRNPNNVAPPKRKRLNEENAKRVYLKRRKVNPIP